jgi:hypothetical protein
MPTYQNCYELVKEIRQGLNEYDDALALGDEVYGAFRNDLIIREINKTIHELQALIARRRPNEFLTEASLTGVDSVFTLPSNFGKLLLFRDNYGRRVFPMQQSERRLFDAKGSDRMYFQAGRTLKLDQAGITNTYTLVYKTLPRPIHMGRASAGDVSSITFDNDFAKPVADYYNGMIVEDVTSDFTSTISDYTAARVATITGTAAADDFYALVPEIPEWAHPLIGPRTTIKLKSNPVSKEKPNRSEISDYESLLITTFREFCTVDEDQDWEETFTSFEPKGGGFII